MRRYVAPPPSPPHIYLGHIPKGYLGTRQTVEHIKALIRAGAKDFYVRQKAIDILLQEGIQPKDYLGEIKALFEWVQGNVRYTRDPFKVEVLHSARRMLELRAGDCDDLTILLGAMLKGTGHPVRLVLAGPDLLRPRLFSHIYLEVHYTGRWIALDPTMPHPMGWAPPAAYREVFHVERESNMIGMTDDELQGWTPHIGQAPATIPWLPGFVDRLEREGARRRDAQIRSLWRILRQQRRLGRRTWMRQFLSAAWRRGIQARDPRIAQFTQQLREWGLLPRVAQPAQPTQPTLPSGLPVWYQRPPWWYYRPPPWWRGGMPTIPAPPGYRRFLPTGVAPPRPMLPSPIQALTSPMRALTSPVRALRRIFG